jgi:hypothetical protein
MPLVAEDSCVHKERCALAADANLAVKRPSGSIRIAAEAAPIEKRDSLATTGRRIPGARVRYSQRNVDSRVRCAPAALRPSRCRSGKNLPLRDAERASRTGEMRASARFDPINGVAFRMRHCLA